MMSENEMNSYYNGLSMYYSRNWNWSIDRRTKDINKLDLNHI